MASGKGFEEQSAALDALRGETSGRAEAELRKALRQRNNFLVAKAATLVREMRLTSLTGELADAFRRFMPESGNDAAKTARRVYRARGCVSSYTRCTWPVVSCV